MESEKTKQQESTERQKQLEIEGKVIIEQEKRKTIEREYENSRNKAE